MSDDSDSDFMPDLDEKPKKKSVKVSSKAKSKLSPKGDANGRNGATDPSGSPEALAAVTNVGGAKKGGNKRMSVERIYQKKTQLEHILLRWNEKLLWEVLSSH